MNAGTKGIDHGNTQHYNDRSGHHYRPGRHGDGRRQCLPRSLFDDVYLGRSLGHGPAAAPALAWVWFRDDRGERGGAQVRGRSIRRRPAHQRVFGQDAGDCVNEQQRRHQDDHQPAFEPQRPGASQHRPGDVAASAGRGDGYRLGRKRDQRLGCGGAGILPLWRQRPDLALRGQWRLLLAGA